MIFKNKIHESKDEIIEELFKKYHHETYTETIDGDDEGGTIPKNAMHIDLSNKTESKAHFRLRAEKQHNVFEAHNGTT